MRKYIRGVNWLFLMLSVAGAYVYDRLGGLQLKALSASVFVVLGLINAGYALKMRRFTPLYMLPALLFCMAADLLLGRSFILGAALFAVGHMFYTIAFCRMEKFRKQDLYPAVMLFAPACALMLFWRRLHFGGAVMQGVCIAYAGIISLMAGKAWGNFRRKRCRAYALIALGSALFVFSDIMLLCYVFADAPPITDTLCLFTYFPGQCLLSHAMYYLAEG